MLQSFRRVSTCFFLLLCFCLVSPTETQAQIRSTYDQGAIGIAQAIRRLNTNASVLMIGAHPDDEDTALLAYLARGENARTAYLSLTRGDGGQNIIGPELGEALGVIRSEELLQARTLDGAEQFFTRAYDFGFSKTLAEARQKWDEKVILCDVVRVIRSFRPLVLVAQFTGTPVDGHGQHQFAGYIAPLAVKAADDASQCKDAGPAWKVKKFYVRARGQGTATMKINTGVYDHFFGRSYFEIAMQARSQHRTQEQGILEYKGARYSELVEVESLGPSDGIHFFDYVTTDIAGIRADLGDEDKDLLDRLVSIQGIAAEALNYHDDKTPQRVTDGLVKGYSVASEFAELAKNPVVKAAALRKRDEFARAIKISAGVQIDALSDRETVVPGESLSASVRLYFSNPKMIQKSSARLNAAPGWIVDSSSVPVEADQQGRNRTETADYSVVFQATAPGERQYTRPYWLKEARDGNLYRWNPKDERLTYPFDRPALVAEVTLTIQGVPITFYQPVQFRYADDTRGEIRREVNVVPKLAVGLDQELLVVSNQSASSGREVVVSVTNNTGGTISGDAMLAVPKGWKVRPETSPFSMSRKGEKTSVKFSVAIPRGAALGSHDVKAVVTSGGESFSETMQTIAYEHIQTHRIYRPAVGKVEVVDLKVAPVKVGYIRGSGDRILEATRQLGVTADEIDERTLASGDLSTYDTIIVGIRAYQVREDVVANNQRLLDFARNGGTLVVQYQLPPTYSQRNLTPYPTQMGPRVVDEEAAVTISEPGNPVFTFPNKITSKDFKGWVQERNLYNFVQMDPKYVGLLESHDSGEAENKGGLVLADLGRGKYVYCSYSLFRQLPAGVPGAYRLLANLVSLPKAPQ